MGLWRYTCIFWKTVEMALWPSWTAPPIELSGPPVFDSGMTSPGEQAPEGV